MPVTQSVYDAINDAVRKEFVGRPLTKNLLFSLESFVHGMLATFQRRGELEEIPRIVVFVDQDNNVWIEEAP